ncbi:hypothetical protein [Halanaerobaculum tunisiense]
MLIEYQTTLAWRCPRCSKLELEQVNIFDFSGTDKLKLDCDCGETKLLIIKEGSNFRLKYPCIFCDTQHSQFYNATEFWFGDVESISCSTNQTALGYFGPEDRLEELVREEEEYLEQMMDKLEFEDCFDSPQIMLAAVNELHDIAMESGLVCQCGSQEIDIEMLAGEIELICQECEGVTKIQAQTEEDLASLRKLKKIKILEGVVSALEKTNG